MKEQFFLTTEIVELRFLHYLTGGSQIRILSKLYTHKTNYSLWFHKNITCLNFGLLRTCQVFSFPCKNCLSVGYEKLLLLDRNTNCGKISCILVLNLTVYILTTWLLKGRGDELRDKKGYDFRYSDTRNKIIMWGFYCQCNEH
jgi:hypothetical protein